MNFRIRAATATVLLTLATLAAPLNAAIVYSEGVSGELSNNPSAPTHITSPARGPLLTGDNDVVASSGFGDTDYFRIDIGPLQRLTGVVVKSYVGGDPTSFIAVQRGPTFTVSAAAAQPEDLDGYAHFGPSSGNILDDMGAGFGARNGGFTPPLGEGSYTFWVQQLGGTTNYTLNFQVSQIPEPASLGAALVAVAVVSRRRKQ